MKQSKIILKLPYPSDNKTSKPSEPRKGTFYDPAVTIPTQLSPVLMRCLGVVFSMRDDGINPPFRQKRSESITVVGAVSNESLGCSRYGKTELFCKPYFGRRGGFQENANRNSFSVSDHHPLGTLAPLGFSDLFAPFFAGAKLPSSKHSRQSIRSCFFNVRRNVTHRLRNIFASTHSSNRRWQVELAANRSGISFHGASVFKTHRMPFRHFRLSMRGLPPFGDGGTVGICGAIAAHWRSVRPCHAI